MAEKAPDPPVAEFLTQAERDVRGLVLAAAESLFVYTGRGRASDPTAHLLARFVAALRAQPVLYAAVWTVACAVARHSNIAPNKIVPTVDIVWARRPGGVRMSEFTIACGARKVFLRIGPKVRRARHPIVVSVYEAGVGRIEMAIISDPRA